MKRWAVLVALSLVATACGGASTSSTATSGGTVGTGGPVMATSPDGRLAITVDQPGVSAVTIDPIAASDLPFGDVDLLAGYEMGPDGTEFDRPATAVFDTNIELAGTPVPIVAAFIENDDGEWEVLPTTLTEVDGSLVAEVEVAHFSRLVFLGAEQALYLDPPDYYGYVGDVWDAYWDLFDRRFVALTNDPGRFGVAYNPEEDTRFVGRARDLADSTDIEIFSTYSGVVDIFDEEPPTLGTYDYFPVGEPQLIPRAPVEWVEIFYGVDAFTCFAAGPGTFGFDVDIFVDRPDLLFGGRTFSGQVVFVRPSDGVRIRYAIVGDAYCDEGPRHLLHSYLYLRHGTAAAILESLIPRMDPRDDLIYSISRLLAGIFDARVDLERHASHRFPASTLTLDHLYTNSVYSCGSTVFDEALGVEVHTVCPDGVVPIPEGEVVVVAAEYAQVLPSAGDESHYTYAVVFESNDDPADDWQFQGEFDWDFFIGTDRWYQLHWDPNSASWSLVVSDALAAAAPSGARALIMGDTLLWVIPKGELPAEVPEYRVTSFAHDGTYRAEVSGGDVSGADPTEPLTPVDGE